MGAITGAIWGGGWRENAGKTATARVLMATAWVRAPSMERMGSRAALRASHRLARSLPCEPRLWQRPQSARAEADLTRLGWQCGQRRSLCVAAQRSRLVFSGPLHGCLGCQGARTHAPTISRGAVAVFVPFASHAHSARVERSGPRWVSSTVLSAALCGAVSGPDARHARLGTGTAGRSVLLAPGFRARYGRSGRSRG